MGQNHRGGHNSNSRRLQKKKAPLLRRLIHFEMLVVALLTAFFLGKRVGQITAKEQILEVVQASVSSQEYGAENEKLLELKTKATEERTLENRKRQRKTSGLESTVQSMVLSCDIRKKKKILPGSATNPSTFGM